MKIDTSEIKSISIYFVGTLLAVIYFSTNSIATNYYVSAAGNDSNSGTTPEQAWLSLERVNNFTPKPGDSILFRRGDEWNGSITANIWGMEGRPVVYGAYGTGPKPKIYGSQQIVGWEKHSENIYKARFENKINQLFLNGTRLRPARWPNSGYSTIEAKNGEVSLRSRGLDPNIDYAGAIWFGRTGVYHTEIQNVIYGKSGVLTLESAVKGGLDVNKGFILMNKLEFLDQEGEWYYDDASKTVYVWTPKGDSPSNYSVRGSVFEYGFYSRFDHIHLRDIEFLHQAHSSVYTNGCRYITIDNVGMMYPDRFGIYNTTSDKGDYRITNSKVVGANHQGIHIRMPGITVTGNELSEIALFENIGLSGNGEYYYGTALYAVGAGSIIRYNRIRNVGYNGIFFADRNNKVEYNFIENTTLLKGDGGGIYTTQPPGSNPTTGSQVRYNIILNTLGSKAGIDYRHFSNGIYIDESAHGVLVEHNTVYKSSDAGIKLHKVDSAVIRYNTVLDSRYAIQVVHASGSTPTQIRNNILYSTSNGCIDNYEPRQLLIRTSSANVVIEENVYRNPYESKGIFRGETYCSFSEWKNLTGFDQKSSFNSISILPGEKEQLLYNDSRQSKTIDLGNKVFKDIDGKEVKGSIRLEPFTSVILIGSNFDFLLQ